jgi:hypothetical protein
VPTLIPHAIARVAMKLTGSFWIGTAGYQRQQAGLVASFAVWPGLAASPKRPLPRTQGSRRNVLRYIQYVCTVLLSHLWY